MADQTSGVGGPVKITPAIDSARTALLVMDYQPVVRKTRVGAFSTTDLDRQPLDQRIDTLILAGISTSGVVLSTVRDAADRDYRLYVLEDACTDRGQDVHDLLTQKVFPRQACVISSADLSSLWGAE